MKRIIKKIITLTFHTGKNNNELFWAHSCDGAGDVKK